MNLTRPLRILQVNTSDVGGGAERSASNLCNAFGEMGHMSWLAVGAKRSVGERVLQILHEPYRSVWARTVNRAAVHAWRHAGGGPGAWRLMRLLKAAGEPLRLVKSHIGVEDFEFPGTAQLLALPPEPPDILHCHNLHGAYFDLAQLPVLARKVPVVLNLRDEWLLSGHCAYSFDCDRWKSGCGRCPDLSIYPPVKRDATARNWKRKRDIFAGARFFVSTPSTWLMNRVRKSMLAPSIIESRVIPNGVDVRVFRPANSSRARDACGLPRNVRIVLCAGSGSRGSAWMDHAMLRRAIEVYASDGRTPETLIVALGGAAPSDRIGAVRMDYVAYQRDPAAIARYLQAADIYLHPARVEAFGNVLSEARACGLPVISTSVGGIPEHVRGLHMDGADPALGGHGPETATGILVSSGQSAGMAAAMALLMGNDVLRSQLSRNGIQDTRDRFTLNAQARTFVDWYYSITSRPVDRNDSAIARFNPVRSVLLKTLRSRN